ncbi:hypothetical protein F5Y13DRAFT_197844 [Hypoxylon sp. FL1857]|nr:hypothetical protein F5Y13DRAFT_197844 [Hypoxylon sp. FL1857]
MDIGLDELIESLLVEIAFSGVRGCSVSALLKAIESFYSDAQDELTNDVGAHSGEGRKPDGVSNSDSGSPIQQATSDYSHFMGSKVWGWLVARPDVSVGTDRQFNHLSLDEILALPEEEDDLPSLEDAKASKNQVPTPSNNPQRSSRSAREPAGAIPKYRPRLHVSEEHFKRVPLFEWKALVDIASTREKGILQGDLVRLTGQDKRSLPTRTDALAKKGYIIKQPIILRGCRSSKLWLTKFADSARQGRDETLTKDLAPVPFSSYWNDDKIDYIAIAQAFNAVLKAWGLMRYSDMRIKAVAKTSRWFTSIGAATFVAARFANGQRLFKDCIKFIREPTAEEWRVFRTTPTAHIKVPSARLGKRGQASRARFSKGVNASPHSQAKRKKIASNPEPLNQEELMPSLWTPYKPMVNTAYEIIKRAGPRGSSNAYRKYIAALTGTLSLPHSQPLHLKRFEVASQLNRVGKTMTYQFFANNEAAIPSTEQQDEDKVQDQETVSTAPASNYAFAQPVLSQFAVLRVPEPKRGRKRKMTLEDRPANDTRRTKQARPSKKPRIEEQSSVAFQGDERPMDHQEAPSHGNNSAIISVVDPQEPIYAQEPQAPSPPPPPPPRPSGVYREPDNMLDPPGKKGRRKKSLVLTFKFDSLKDLSFLERMRNLHPTTVRDSPSGPTESSPNANFGQSASQSGLGDDSVISAEAVTAESKQKKGRRGGKSSYRCDKCGNSWKNPNGLEYHLSKSRTSCNSDYVAPPLPPPKPPKVPKQPPKPKLKLKNSSKVPENQNRDRTPDLQTLSDLDRTPQPKPDPVIRRPLLPSKRIRPSGAIVHNQDIGDSSRPDSIRGSIILQNVEAYDVIDRRRRENSQVTSPSFHNSISLARQTSQAKDNAPSRVQEQDVVSNSGSGKERGMPTILKIQQATPIPNLEMRTERPEVQLGLHFSNANHAGDLSGALAMSDFTLRPPMLKPTIPTNGPISGTSTLPPTANYSIANGTGNRQVPKATDHELSKGTMQPNQESTPKKSRKSTPTVGTLRRERTTLLIQHLLDKNDGVFPGQRSLYLAVVSLWVRKHRDIEPPDWKVCQNVVNRMEKAGALRQMHFCFLDDTTKLQECCVLVKNNPGDPGTANLAADPKVLIVKEKMREMFPEPYIPDAFSLPQEESKLFDALSSKYRDTPQPSESPKKARKSSVTEDIEVLQYPAHVMSDIPSYATGSKRPLEEEDILANTSPPKKIRADSRDTDKPRSTPKPRKRGEPREYWDTGKVAKYIWNQKQNPSEKWNQKVACLQDFSTGAWSSSPQEVSPFDPSIDTILSSLRTSRENALASTRPRSNSKPEVMDESFKENHGRTFRSVSKSRNSRKPVVDRFVKPSVSTSFIPSDSGSEEEDEDTVMVDTQHNTHTDEDSNVPSGLPGVRFARAKRIQSTRKGYWPLLSTNSFEVDSSFILAGTMPDAKWFQRENLPQNAGDIIKTFKGKFQFGSWADPKYGKFLREVDIIEKWEQSPEGSQILLHGSIAPDYVFISLSPDISKAKMDPLTLEWPARNQYTAENIPDEIKNASPEDDNAGLPSIVYRGRGRPKAEAKTKAQSKTKSKATKSQPAPGPKVEIQYKTRPLNPIPIQHRGRVNRPNPNEDNLGLSGETELIAAFVVFKILLGGVDKKVDLGLILKTFPTFSHSSLRKFWPRACRERKTYIDALTNKFQSAFLEAYEKGEIKPLNYDDLESYDWKSLVVWASKLETHENVDLPESRQALEKAYSLEDQINEAPDWRETWFHGMASTLSRVEATAGEPISLPLSRNVTAEEELISRARSWVRSLCVTPIQGANTPEEIRQKFLKLSGRNEADTNKLLKRVVDRLTTERIAARSRGKILGQALRLHGVFAKHLQKAATVEKFTQAAKFKTLLDQTFRKGEEYILPYVTDDGSILATINLQAQGRIRVEAIDVPNIPFGFEPGNYDGRTFPKSYYHFNLKLVPTETYVFDKDLPPLKEALRMEAPLQGPRDEIPIWVDFFGNLDKQRWITYLSMVMQGLATRGPLTPNTASALMKPFVEPFEAKLIMDWVDSLGVLQRLESQHSATVGEWWWLVVGTVALGQREESTP